MTTDTLPRRPRRVADLPGIEPARDAARVLGTVLWVLTIRLRLASAALISWFAEEPRRIWIAFLGIATGVVTGAAVGLAASIAVVRTWEAFLAMFQVP